MPEDIIGEVVLSFSDVTGKKVAHFYPHGDAILGLANENLRQAQEIAERIWSRREVRDRLSADTVEELLLEWVGAVARGQPTQALAQRIDEVLLKRVRVVSVWVPIEATLIEGDLQFADSTLMMLSRVDLDRAFDSAFSTRPSDHVEEYRKKLHRDWAGKAVMRFSICAEPKRAHELSLEKAETYMTLLQFYTIPAMAFSLSSHAAPVGQRPYRTKRSIAIGPSIFLRSAAIAEPSSWLQITRDYRAQMEQMGLMVLSSLARDTACEYEEKLLEALLIYGRACYQSEPVDKLLQIMTAVEMFALRSDGEPITTSVADRIAFAITDDPGTRQEIVRNFRDVYAIRSRRSHHGRFSSEVQMIEQFLRNAWAFFLTAIRGVGRYRERVQFLDYLDGLKYGRPPL